MQQGLFARFSRCFAFEHAFPCFRRAYNFRHVCRPHNEQYLHFFTRHITSEFSSVDVIRRAQTSINSFDKFNNIYQFIENLFLKTDTYHDERNMHERNNIHSHIVTLYNCFDNQTQQNTRYILLPFISSTVIIVSLCDNSNDNSLQYLPTIPFLNLDILMRFGTENHRHYTCYKLDPQTTNLSKSRGPNLITGPYTDVTVLRERFESDIWPKRRNQIN